VEEKEAVFSVLKKMKLPKKGNLWNKIDAKTFI